MGVNMLSVTNVLCVNPYVASLLVTLTFCYLAWYLWGIRPANSPPGTKGLPFLGVVLAMMTAFPERMLQTLGKKYGPLYMVKFGTIDVVVISSPEIAYEAFAKNDCFNDRLESIPTFDGKGILLMRSSDFHKEQRRFGLNTLRDFGMGRRSLEPRLLELTNELCVEIDSLCSEKGTSKPFDITHRIYETISSVISQIIFGHDVSKENRQFKALIEELTEPKATNVLIGIMMFAPFLRHLPVFNGAWNGCEVFRNKMHSEIRTEVIEHQKSRDPNQPRDFIDCFLNEMDKAENCDSQEDTGVRQNQGSNALGTSLSSFDDLSEFSEAWKPLSSFSVDQLLGIVRDLFIAGTDTTSTTICWIILYMCKYPDVQKKMQQEIDDVLGQSGVPRMSIMEKLPYVRAVIQEVTRIRPVVPLSVPHMASRDASLLGYRIPKGAIILTNIWAIHHDETRWPEPDKFSPERHLDEDGKFIKSSNWMGFSLGGRACLGQQLAKMELFFATVTLFRRFYFELPSGEHPDMNGESKVSLHPWHYKVVLTRR